MSTQHEDTPEALVELMELTAAELERRAERLLKLSRDLLAQSAHHASLIALPDERSLAAGGRIVAEPDAIRAARELQRFSRSEFAAKLGLSPSGVSRWLAKLIEREHPVIERLPEGGYRYVDPSPVSELRRPRAARTRRQRASTVGSDVGVRGTGGDLLRGVHKDLTPVVREAIGEGWTLGRRSDGHFTLTRHGRVVPFPATPRNGGNAAQTLRQRLRSVRRVAQLNGHARST